jgi:hypothetical protein
MRPVTFTGFRFPEFAGWFSPQGIQKGNPMTLVIRQFLWHSLSAAILISVFGSVDLPALAEDSPESPVVKEVAQKEKPQKEARREKESREGGQRGEDQAEAKERLVNLEREIDELRAAGKLDQAEKLTREFKELKGKLEERREKKGDKPAEVSDKLQGRLKELEAENARLRELVGSKEKGKGGEGKELSPKKSPENKSPEKKSPEKSDGEKKSAEGAAEVQNKLKAIENEIAELRKAGRKEEAEKLTGVAKELAQHLAKSGPATKLGMSPEEKGKLQVVHKELAKLRAEGRHDDAKRLEQQIQNVGNENYWKKVSEKGFEKPGAAASHELGTVLKELREEVHRLRNEVAELRRAVKGSEEKPGPRK